LPCGHGDGGCAPLTLTQVRVSLIDTCLRAASAFDIHAGCAVFSEADTMEELDRLVATSSS